MIRPTRKGFAGVRWTPKIAPTVPEELPKYLFDELQALSDHLIRSDKLHLEKTYKNIDDRDSGYVGPSKPTDGDIIYADEGVVGEHSGLYYYDGVDWVFGIGPQGPQGDIGPQGPKGDTGPAGPKGDDGD